jgi:glycosyltransferase involved in cell wall biosynthesis
MRVLFVTNRYPTDETPGSSPCVAQQRRALQRLGYEVDLLFINSEQTTLNYLKAMWRVFWASQVKNQYDLIHAHYGYCGVVARMQFRCPVIVTFRGSDVLLGRERLLSWLVARCVDTTIVMTKEMKRVLGRSDAHVIPYGIDLDLFKPRPQAEARRALGLPLETPLVLFPYDPGRGLKRFDLVQQAVTILREEFPDIQVLAIYDKPHEAVATYMNACDVMVLTSKSEGAPVAVREAMACNLPIVSVDVGDVADIIRGTKGCYICRRTPDDIAAKLAQLLKARKRTNGRLTVSGLDLSKAAVAVANVYQELLTETPGSRLAKVSALDRIDK